MTHLPGWSTAVRRIRWHSGHLHNQFPNAFVWEGLWVIAVWLYWTVLCVFAREWDLLKASEWETVMTALACPIATVPGTVGSCIQCALISGMWTVNFPDKRVRLIHLVWVVLVESNLITGDPLIARVLELAAENHPSVCHQKKEWDGWWIFICVQVGHSVKRVYLW